MAEVVALVLALLFGVLTGHEPAAPRGHDSPPVELAAELGLAAVDGERECIVVDDIDAVTAVERAARERVSEGPTFHAHPLSQDRVAVIQRRAFTSPWIACPPPAIWFELLEAEGVVDEPVVRPQLEVVVVQRQAPASPRGPPARV